jgi:hypothetical protein
MAFDPTPRDFQTGPVQSAWALRLSEALDYVNLQWNRQILSYDFERQVSIVRTITTRSQSVSFRFENMAKMMGYFFHWKRALSAGRPEQAGRRGSVLFPLAGLLAVVAFVVLLLRKAKRERNAVWFYRGFLASLEKAGGKKPEAKTITEFVENLEGKLGPRAPAALFLAEEYHRLRFGKVLSDEESNRRVQAALSQLRNA